MAEKDLNQENKDRKGLLEKIAENLNSRRPTDIGTEFTLSVLYGTEHYQSNFYLVFKSSKLGVAIHLKPIYDRMGHFYRGNIIDYAISLGFRHNRDRTLTFKKIKSTKEFNFDKIAESYWSRLKSYIAAEKMRADTRIIEEKSERLVKIVLDELGIEPYNPILHIESSKRDSNKVQITLRCEMTPIKVKLLVYRLNELGHFLWKTAEY